MDLRPGIQAATAALRYVLASIVDEPERKPGNVLLAKANAPSVLEEAWPKIGLFGRSSMLKIG